MSMRFVVSACGVALAMAISGPCHALFHLFDFTEVFSNSDGTIQFIEMSTNSNNQNQIGDHSITADSHFSTPFVFDKDLPDTLTAGKSLLIATAGFAALPGAVTPDYVMPNNFFSVNGDIIDLVGGAFQRFNWVQGELPIDGVNSLNRAIGGTAGSPAANSPKNYAGQTGSIDLSEPDPLDIDITEVFSNAEGTIRFIEMRIGSNNQNLLAGLTIVASSDPGSPFTFDDDLPDTATSSKTILIATAGFAALPGAVTPDFILPDNFFNVNVDTLTFPDGAYDPFTWPSGQLPLNGINSLHREFAGGTPPFAAANSPMNYAGQTGSIDVSFDPTEVYVRFADPDGGTGTIGLPFNTLAEGVAAVADAGTIFVFEGQTGEAILIDVPKQFVIEAVSGTVIIGAIPPRPGGFRSRSSNR